MIIMLMKMRVMSVAKADIGLGLSDMLLQELTAMLAIFALIALL